MGECFYTCPDSRRPSKEREVCFYRCARAWQNIRLIYEKGVPVVQMNWLNIVTFALQFEVLSQQLTECLA